MEFEKFMQIGKTLGLEKEDLQTFVKEQMEEWKEQMRLNREERAIVGISSAESTTLISPFCKFSEH